MKLFGSLSRLVSILFRKDSQDITVRPNQSTTYTAARDVQLPAGNADHVLISRTSTDTLTNKSIDADTNTITNIENADIKAAAGIVESKLTLDFATSTLNTNITNAQTNINNLVTLSGVAANATTLGTFTGTTIPDSSTNKAALQSLETYGEATRALINGLEWQASALDYIVNNTIAPPTEVSGNRYILSHDGGTPHANWDGAAAGNIVEFNGTVWVATAATTGMFISADDESTLLYYWGGSSWTSKAFESTTASTGLTKVGVDIRLADAAENASGIQVSGGVITLNDLGAFNADNLAEGATNKYYTDEKAQDAVGTILTDTSSIDFTYNDGANTISAAVLPAGVDHDALQNFVANEHIDHSAVSIATSATSGLSGGGDITTTRNLLVAPTAATAATVTAADTFLFADASDSDGLKKATIQGILDLAPASSNFSTTWADGSATKAVTHNLNSLVVLVEIYDQNNETVLIDIVDRDTVNSLALTRSEATVGGTWTVVVRA